MTKNQTDGTIINQSDGPTIDDKLIQQYKDIFSAYIENGDGYSLYELSKLVRMCMEQSFGPERLLDLHFSVVSEFMEERKKKIPDLVKRLATYDLIYCELIKGLSDKVKESMKALQKSEQYIRSLVSSMDDLVFVIGMDGTFRNYYQPSRERDLYVPPSEFLGKNFKDLLPPEVSQLLQSAMKQIEISGETQQFSYALEIKGRRSWYDAKISPIRDQSGVVTEAISVVRDITDRKHAEEALSESERSYRLLAENASDVIWTVDLDMRLTYVSPSVTRLLGYSVEEAMANTMEEVFTPASYERAVNALAEELEIENRDQKDPNRSRKLELDLCRKDGSIVTVEGNFSFLREPDGHPAQILAIVRDITERKQAEKTLKESEEKYRYLVESTDDNIYLLDRNCRFILANNRYLSRLGVPRDQVIGKSYGEIHPAASTTVKAVEEVFKTGKSINHEHRSHRNGKCFLQTFSPVKDPKTGNIIAVTVISKDITGYKQDDFHQKG
ncbi:MAG: PAS domain S-box protein [Methanocellales archaeon]|nr:PAS domain S-box protein [Methanocellales archaeon]MDD3291576.1 PAS domain S-box protein [Methanocellales archaeon]MDD5235866.1 PAS domain S-box protein [Methanocellales archaeon]MDD5485359.1 PAS domain S-box protein [Methanocellales archaeon]